MLCQIFVLGFSAAALASDQEYFLCKNGVNVRTVRVHKPEGSENYSITYTKGGADQVVGSGKNFEFCKSVAQNIRANLQKQGWSCRDVSQAKID